MNGRPGIGGERGVGGVGGPSGLVTSVAVGSPKEGWHADLEPSHGPMWKGLNSSDHPIHHTTPMLTAGMQMRALVEVSHRSSLAMCG